jgi:hypothetical protein
LAIVLTDEGFCSIGFRPNDFFAKQFYSETSLKKTFVLTASFLKMRKVSQHQTIGCHKGRTNAVRSKTSAPSKGLSN